MLYITGDTHGKYDRILQFDSILKPNDSIIVAGDFGFVFHDNESEKATLDEIEMRPYTILFVDGNHENHPAIAQCPEEMWNGGKVHRIRKNILHLCRGQVYNIEGKTFFAFGGGCSRDKERRLRLEIEGKGKLWWAEEMPSKEEYTIAEMNLDLCGRKVDYIITHTAPEETMCVLRPFHEPERELNNYLEYVRETVAHKHWYMGHLHKDMAIWRNQTIVYQDIRKIGDE